MSETDNKTEGSDSIITHAHAGPIIGVLSLMLILILGGLYMWGGLLAKPAVVAPIEKPIVNNEPETPRAVADTQILEIMSPSDEISAIEADLESTRLDSLDADLNTMDAEFEAALAE